MGNDLVRKSDVFSSELTCFTYFLMNKDEVANNLRDFLLHAKNNNIPIKKIRTDQGKDFIDERFIKQLKEEGIEHQTKLNIHSCKMI